VLAILIPYLTIEQLSATAREPAVETNAEKRSINENTLSLLREYLRVLTGHPFRIGEKSPNAPSR